MNKGKQMKLSVLLASMVLVLSSAGVMAHGDGASHQAQISTVSKAKQHAFGKAGNPKKITRTIVIEMTDTMRFTPGLIQVKQGETIKLMLHNSGKLMHELVIGSLEEMQEHAAMMKKFPDMHHAEPYMSHVAPGQTGGIVWTFNRVGEFDFACLLPGHFEAGMLGKIRVSAS
jgi:uncharacterized cupredoxin-like copper-binding protein